jgi:hypothetical protein
MNISLRRSIAGLLIVSITALGMPLPVQAGMVSTESAVAADRNRIATMLDRPEVRAQLEARGVSSTDAKARVAALTDEEVVQLAGRIDSLPAAGGGDPLSGLFAAVILAAFLVVLVVAALIKGITLIGQGIGSLSKQTSTDDSRTGAGQETEVGH